MQDTANSIITDAFEDIVVLTSESPIESTDAQTAIRALNRVMASLAASGINLGYTEVTKLSDVITVPAGASDPIIALLAMRLWTKYRSTELPSSVVINAREAKRVLAHIAVSPPTSDLPSTLPVGSGNEEAESTSRFYAIPLDTITTEQEGVIALEDNTDE